MMERKPTLNALLSVRFFAAIHVVFHHYLIMIPGFRTGAPDWVKRWVASAPTEVTLFFVLSGFVLAYNYLRLDGSMPATKREFWVLRVARVYPIYLFGLLVYAPIAVARYLSGTANPITGAGAGVTFAVGGIASLFLVQSWTIVFQVWNSPCWSVSDEAAFYSVFPWLAPRIMQLPLRRLLQWGTALWLVSLLLPTYFLIFVLGHSSKETKELWEVGLDCIPLLRIVAFLAGIATAALFLRTRGDSAARPWLLNASALAILIACVFTPTSASRLLEYALTPLLVLLVYLLAFGNGALARLLSHPVAVRLGEASYALYIIHNPLWNYMARLPNVYSIVFHQHFPVGIAKPGAATEWNYDMSSGMFVLYLVILVALGLLAQRYIETPARSWLRRRFAGSGRRAAAALVSGAAESGSPA